MRVGLCKTELLKCAVTGSDVGTAVIEIDHVTKRFDDLVAVNQISLRVDKGQTLGLIGPNGAGKTTLLRMICTLAIPDRGDIRICGESIRKNPRAVRKMLGFMPAEFGNPKNLTIGEYLEYFGCMYGLPQKERRLRIQQVCELTDLCGREGVFVKGLSTGNRQRLLLAKTLLHDPEILVLDEPASGLDPRARTELRGIVRELAAMGKTIIISSHILPDIEDISDRIGIIEAGQLVLDGDLQGLRNQHQASTHSVNLRVPIDQTPRALEILKKLSGVKTVEQRGALLLIASIEPNQNFVLAELLKHEIRILQFAEDELSLEEIFMQSTAGKVT